MKKLSMLAMALGSVSLWAAPDLGNLNGVVLSGAATWRPFEFSSGTLRKCESTPPESKDFQVCEIEGATFRFTDETTSQNPFAGATKLVYKRGPGGKYEVFTFVGRVAIPAGSEKIDAQYGLTFSLDYTDKNYDVRGSLTVGGEWGERSNLVAKRR